MERNDGRPARSIEGLDAAVRSLRTQVAHLHHSGILDDAIQHAQRIPALTARELALLLGLVDQAQEQVNTLLSTCVLIETGVHATARAIAPV